MKTAGNSPTPELLAPSAIPMLELVIDTPSPVQYWLDVAEEYPHLLPHAMDMINYVLDVDELLVDDTVASLDFYTVDTWYRLHGSFNFLPKDRQELFLIAADKLQVSAWSDQRQREEVSWAAVILRGNLIHEAALITTDPVDALNLLRDAQADYEELKDIPVAHPLVRKALMHWHDANLEIERIRNRLRPDRYTERHFIKRQKRYLGALACRLEEDDGRKKKLGHLTNLAGDAWEMFGIAAYNDSLIQKQRWQTRIARSSFSRENEPLYGLPDEGGQKLSPKDIDVERWGFDIVIPDLETGLHVPIQAKSGGMNGKAYSPRIRRILGKYRNKHQELISDVRLSLDVLLMQYTGDEASYDHQATLRHLCGLAHTDQLVDAKHTNRSNTTVHQ